MAESPPIKIYRNREYVASTKYFEDAAAIAGMSSGTVIKWRGSKTIWVEGQEEVKAADSWDEAAEIMRKRVAEINERAYERAHGNPRKEGA
jgi:hypothetical protein